MNNANARLWGRWVLANAVGEVLGLGATFAVGAAIFVSLGERQGIAASMLMVFLMTFSGAIEGVVVGVLQWSVLRSALPRISRRSWVSATVLGTVIAWFLGSLPTTMLEFGGGTEAAMQEPPALLTFALAGGMGLFLGIVLGLPQWRVLLRDVPRAWVWLPANAAAWFLGMPLIFAGVDRAMETGSVTAGLVSFIIVLALAGAVVGAVHGAALVWLRGVSQVARYA